MVSRKSDYLENLRAVFSVKEQVYLKRKLGRNRPMNERLAIDGRDDASVDRNGAIKLHLSDHRWRTEMSPHF